MKDATVAEIEIGKKLIKSLKSAQEIFIKNPSFPNRSYVSMCMDNYQDFIMGNKIAPESIIREGN